jgi:hypothetical protein
MRGPYVESHTLTVKPRYYCPLRMILTNVSVGATTKWFTFIQGQGAHSTLNTRDRSVCLGLEVRPFLRQESLSRKLYSGTFPVALMSRK